MKVNAEHMARTCDDKRDGTQSQNNEGPRKQLHELLTPKTSDECVVTHAEM